jgi:murein L,D-transpeptidase YcbB/YkuD
MENFKFIVFSIIIIGALGLAGYWAFTTIESGSTHVDNQKQKQLLQQNAELEKQVADLNRQIGLLQVAQDAQAQKDQAALDAQATTPPATPTNTPTTPKTTVSNNQSLINDLQKLIDGNIFLKLKSQGIAVGTVQKFLNVYNNTSNKIDNDYGASTVSAVKDFQKDQGLTADGQSGSGTFKKMISWLNAH